MNERTTRCPKCGAEIDYWKNVSRAIDLLIEARDALGLTVAELRAENERLKAELAAFKGARP